MPLAMGYLKAVLDADAEIGPQVEVSICNFRGGTSLPEMARQLFQEDLPNLLAFSVLGWNYRAFTCLGETYKQLNPDGLVVFGGKHVTYQAVRIFREAPHIDVIVNGEGEITFRELVATALGGLQDLDLAAVAGLSYRDANDSIQTTPVIAKSPAVARGLRKLYSQPELDEVIARWWRESIVPRFPAEWREFTAELYTSERWSRPVYVAPGAPVPPGWRAEGEEYVSDPVSFSFAMVETLEDLVSGKNVAKRVPVSYVWHAPCSFYDHLDNHEIGVHYVAHHWYARGSRATIR
jgi:hypothetical protein